MEDKNWILTNDGRKTFTLNACWMFKSLIRQLQCQLLVVKITSDYCARLCVILRVELTGKYDLFFMDIKPCAWFIVRRQKIVELVVLHIGNFSPRWKIWGGKTKYGGLFLNFFHSTIFFSTYPHNLSLCTIFCTL